MYSVIFEHIFYHIYMGMFSSMFGSPSDKYSRDLHPLTELEIKKLVTHEHARSLDHEEEELVEQAIINARIDGKISLHKIAEILRQLKNTKKISKFDKESLMHIFENRYKEYSETPETAETV